MTIREFAAQRLPEYMVPAIVTVMGALPLTANGKGDRKALPAPDYATAVGTTADHGSAAVIEETLCEVFAKALGLDPMKQNDSNVNRPIRIVDKSAKPITEVLA